MFWRAKQKSFFAQPEPLFLSGSWALQMLWALVLFFVVSCSASHRCGKPEECNYVDDDCDGLVDEDFIDEQGTYASNNDCGGCGIDCARVYSTALETTCTVAEDGVAACQIVSCPPGLELVGAGSCVAPGAVLCLPCTSDDECAARADGAYCVETQVGDFRCVTSCSETQVCPAGFVCEQDLQARNVCLPESGYCGCETGMEGLMEGLELACLIQREDGTSCAGIQRCGPEGPGLCEPQFAETCNEQDDDCDGLVDEDFRDADGHYIAALHCGSCGVPCTAPASNMVATCTPVGQSSQCDIACADGYVDVDGFEVNGCECQLYLGSGPPPVGRGDTNCDGVEDDTSGFVFVTAGGDDNNPGTLDLPVRTIQTGLGLAQGTDRSVLVARGIYEGPVQLIAGVDLYGGYSPDFQERDVELYSVLIEAPSAPGGQPALLCENITSATQMDGFIVQATEASQPSAGSTAMYFNGCDSEVAISSLTVFAARGASGTVGEDSSERLDEWGVGSLADLQGVAGSAGIVGTGAGETCAVVSGGAAGQRLCVRSAITNEVSGGAGGAAACAETSCVNGSPCANAGCTDYTVNGVCDIDLVLSLAVPNPAAFSGSGSQPGNPGSLTYNAPTNRVTCNFCDDNPSILRNGSDGGDGAEGADGASGLGCSAAININTSTGVLSGQTGQHGTAGEDGSGGGGGTAGSGYDVIGGTASGCDDRSGGSGAGGGSGGCGAPGATAGTGGGHSAGIVVRLANGLTHGPTLMGVRVVTASGGVGGNGGIGAAGGAGGVGALGGLNQHWCARAGGRGGDGGSGGAGGGGGGGCGGGSHGVVILAAGEDAGDYRNQVLSGTLVDQAGVIGHGGFGGFSPGNSGTNGTSGSGDTVLIIN